jgi:hypothetical protein
MVMERAAGFGEEIAIWKFERLGLRRHVAIGTASFYGSHKAHLDWAPACTFWYGSLACNVFVDFP